MKTDKKKSVNGIEIGNQFGKALNEIENKNFGAAEGYATWFNEHGYPDQANAIISQISESGVKCSHGSTTTKTHRDGEDPYGHWLISTPVCDHCGEELDTPDRKYIITKPKPKSTIAAESMPETPEPETETEPETPDPSEPLTKEQAKYWYAVAKKDISEGNIEGAYNLLKFFETHDNKMYARLLKKAIDKARPETPEPETETPETPEGKLKATIDKKIIRAFVDPMAALSDEIKATITETGINVKVVDPAHVAMLETTLEKRAFTEYKVSDLDLGLDLDKVQSFLKKGNQKKGAYITVDYDGDHNKTIWGNGINNRTIATIDTAGISDPKVPNLNLPNAFTMDRKTLLEAIKEASEVSDHVVIVSGPDGIEISAEGDTDNTKATIPKALLPELDARETARSKFALDYLEAMVKAIKSETVTITMGTDYPLTMKYEYDGITGLYLLAPYIETDD